MAWLSAVGPFIAKAYPYITAATAAAGAYSSYQQGEAAKEAASAQARQLRDKANQERAIAIQEAENIRRQKRHLQSRAIAVAAAGGGAATDPTVVDLIGDLEETGEADALNALWSGNTAARSADYAARVAQYEGVSDRSVYRAKSAATLLDGASSLFSRYATVDEPEDEE
jgi:hypothetical protein